MARADNEQSLLISDIAETYDIPKKFLEQILLALKHHGLVRSKRGKFGGYMLLKRPEEITFGQGLRIVEGPMAPLPCLSKIAYRRCDDCRSESACEIRRVFAVVAESTRHILDNSTLADAISGPGKRPAKARSAPLRKLLA